MSGKGEGSYKIEMHFEEAMRLAEEITAVSNQLLLIYENSLLQTSAAIKSVWNSENAESFARKVVREAFRLEEEALGVKKLAEDLVKDAQRMYHVELLNRTLAENRWYF